MMWIVLQATLEESMYELAGELVCILKPFAVHICHVSDCLLNDLDSVVLVKRFASFFVLEEK